MSDSTRHKEADLPGDDKPVTPSPGGATPDPHGDHPKGTPHSDRHAAETLAGRLARDRPAERNSE